MSDLLPTGTSVHLVEVTVRDAGPTDYPQAAQLLTSAYAEYLRYGDEEPGWIEYVTKEVPDVVSRSDETLIVAEDGPGEMLACITYVAPGRSSSARQGLPMAWAVIRLLAVAPEARGLGLGRRLTEECIARARADGARVVGLNTVSEMKIAQGLYERMGFVREPSYDQQPGKVTILAYRLDLGDGSRGEASDRCA